jgi:hypothetical protein
MNKHNRQISFVQAANQHARAMILINRHFYDFLPLLTVILPGINSSISL